MVVFSMTADARAVLVKQLRVAGQYESMPEEAREKVLEFAPLLINVFGPLGAVMSRLFWILLIAVVAWGFLRLKKPEYSLRHYVAVVAIASVPLYLSDVLMALAFAFKNHQLLNVMNPIQSNPAAWFDLDPQASVLGAILRRIDFFRIWNIGLIAIGIQTLIDKKTMLALGAPLLLYAIAAFSEILSVGSKALFT